MRKPKDNKKPKANKPKRAKPTRRPPTTRKTVRANEHKPFSLPDVKPVFHAEDEGGWGEDGLTAKQREFVKAYVGPAAGNGTEACRLAGYRDDNRNALAVQSSVNLRKPNVQSALAQAFAAKRQDPAWSRNRLAEMASSSMANFVTVGDDGHAETDLRKARDAAALGQIKELEEEVIESGDGVRVVKRKLKIHDPTKAIATLMKAQGQLADTLNVNQMPQPKYYRGISEEEL